MFDQGNSRPETTRVWVMRGKRSIGTAKRPLTSSTVATRSRTSFSSPTNLSIASIVAEAAAACSVTPLPASTASEPEAGRVAMTTGIPIVSRPVMSATRVIPAL